MNLGNFIATALETQSQQSAKLFMCYCSNLPHARNILWQTLILKVFEEASRSRAFPRA
jgi:hypothetical protein